MAAATAIHDQQWTCNYKLVLDLASFYEGSFNPEWSNVQISCCRTTDLAAT